MQMGQLGSFGKCVKMLCSPEVWTLATILRFRLSRFAFELVIGVSLSASPSVASFAESPDSAAGCPSFEELAPVC
jgi:hypothetical protein